MKTSYSYGLYSFIDTKQSIVTYYNKRDYTKLHVST